MPFLLALDSATETMALALVTPGQTRVFEAAGGAQASARLLPEVKALLAAAGVEMAALDAIAFGQGPGAFTGLRTACAVAQGLALGADLPVLPVDTLLGVAEAARGHDTRVLVVMDARMGQVYAAAYAWQGDQWQTLQAPQLCQPTDVQVPTAWTSQAHVLAGNAWAVPALQTSLQALMTDQAVVRPSWPEASALLRLGAAAWQRGEALPADQALPVYVRDQVALTTAERMALKASSP